MNRLLKILLVTLSLTLLPSCLGTLVGSAVDLTIEAVKTPFKIGGAIVDGVTGDDDE